MAYQSLYIICWLLVIHAATAAVDFSHHPSWLLNLPPSPWPSIQHNNLENQELFRYIVRKEMKKLYDEKSSDGESVDALEHFFWGESVNASITAHIDL